MTTTAVRAAPGQAVDPAQPPLSAFAGRWLGPVGPAAGCSTAAVETPPALTHLRKAGCLDRGCRSWRSQAATAIAAAASRYRRSFTASGYQPALKTVTGF